jgi:hypothetical protein
VLSNATSTRYSSLTTQVSCKVHTLISFRVDALDCCRSLKFTVTPSVPSFWNGSRVGLCTAARAHYSAYSVLYAMLGSVRARRVVGAGGGAGRLHPGRLHCTRTECTKPRVPDLSLEREIELPPISACTHFVNLTNGLEAVPHLTSLGMNYQLVRCVTSGATILLKTF